MAWKMEEGEAERRFQRAYIDLMITYFQHHDSRAETAVEDFDEYVERQRTEVTVLLKNILEISLKKSNARRRIRGQKEELVQA